MKKLFLLDAMALIYRAHFAFSKNPRINAKGLNTGAVLGFTNTLLEILQKEKPTHIGVAFDTPAPTFRHTAFEAYKANRQEQPEDIQVAIPYVKRLVKAFTIPVLELDGYEADDVIGTLAKKAARDGFTVYMMTPDKDYGQLVEDQIFLYKPAFMGNDVEIMGVKEVLAKWEIARIDQVIDMLGLQGDSVDNIPGIPGIGQKTAAKLLAEFDSLENLIANADKLKGKQKENVVNFAQQGLLSKQLATIDIEVPIAFDPEALAYHTFDKPVLKALFEELEFRTLAKKLFNEDSNLKPAENPKPNGTGQLGLFESAAPASTATTQPEDETQPDKGKDNIDTVVHQYHLINTPELRAELIEHLGQLKEFCFDTETTDLDALQASLVGLSFSWHAHEGYYVPAPAQHAEAMLNEFKAVFENPAIKKIGQNIKYDIMVLANYGITVKGELFDTMLAHYLLEPDMTHNMNAMSENYLNYTPVAIESLIGKKGKNQGSMQDVPLEDIKEYAAEDADITWQLKHLFAPQLAANKVEKLFKEVEMPLVPVLADIERNGVKIDTEALAAFSQELQADMQTVEQAIYQQAGETFNISSPKQMGDILFEKLKLLNKPQKTKTGQYATGEEVLIKLAPEHKIVSDILEYRQLQKLKSTYVDALPQLISKQDGLIHTSFNQAVAATGRLSSTNPNLQNIPIRTEKGREIRKAFVPRSEEFAIMSADYSQIELRIMAAFSKDETMLQAFRDGRDIHAATAAKIFKVPLEQVDSDMRRKAKTANFGIIYGISAFGLAQRLNIPRKEAAEIIEAYFSEFSKVKQYMDDVIEFAREHEYVETMMGRRRYLRDINSRNFTQRGFAERNAINAPIQGSAADLIKLAMVNIYGWMQTQDLRSKLTLQVHDELVFDVHRDEYELMRAKVKELMENAYDLGVPLEVETGQGPNWLAAH